MDGEHPPPLLVRQADEALERGRDPALGGLDELLLGTRDHALGLGDGGDARVVDPDVDRAEPGLGRLARAVDVGARAHIRLDGDPADEVGGLGRAFEVEVEHGDSRTLAGEADADRPAEPEPPPVTTATFPVTVTEHHRAPVDVAVRTPAPSIAPARPKRSTSMRIAPARASATTSWSSGSDPQLGLLIDHSNGRVPKAMERAAADPDEAHVPGHRDRRRRARASRQCPRSRRRPWRRVPRGRRGHPRPTAPAVESHIRPRLERLLARALAQVHRDDARRRELAQQLHGDVTETAYSDHDDRRSRDEPGAALDGATTSARHPVNGAAPTGSSWPIGTSSRDDGTSTYSASPPS